jgi:hypothetical protein
LPKLTEQANTERLDYEIEDMQLILNNLTWRPEFAERFWVPLIAMLNGWRQDEICQMQAGEVVKIGNNWSVKVMFKKNNDNFHRVLPLHPLLVEFGLPEYATKMAKKHIQLFPNLKESANESFANAFEHWYSLFNRKYITSDSKKVFHSLRHLIRTDLPLTATKPLAAYLS